MSYLATPEESFMDAFGTPRGTVIGNYIYGTFAHKLKHRPFNTDYVIEMRRAFKDACSFDPRLNFMGASYDIKNLTAGIVLFNVDIGIGNPVSLEMAV